MVTLNQLIYNLKNSRNGGDFSDDYKLSSRQLEFIFNHFRAEVAAQRTNDRKSLDGFLQDLPDLKLIATRDFRPTHRQVDILRSKDKLPSLATSRSGGYIIDYVGLRDEMYGFQKSNISTFNLDMENDYVQSTYFMSQGYIYIVTKNPKFIKEIYLKGVFDSPREVLQHQGVNVDTLGYDWEYPIPGNLIGQLNNLVINNEFKWMTLFTPDLVNDGKDGK